MVLFIYELQNMDHMPLVCPQNVRVTTEPIIVAALDVKKQYGAPYLFGLLRDLTFVDRRFWDTVTKLIFYKFNS